MRDVNRDIRLSGADFVTVHLVGDANNVGGLKTFRFENISTFPIPEAKLEVRKKHTIHSEQIWQEKKRVAAAGLRRIFADAGFGLAQVYPERRQTLGKKTSWVVKLVFRKYDSETSQEPFEWEGPQKEDVALMVALEKRWMHLTLAQIEELEGELLSLTFGLSHCRYYHNSAGSNFQIYLTRPTCKKPLRYMAIEDDFPVLKKWTTGEATQAMVDARERELADLAA